MPSLLREWQAWSLSYTCQQLITMTALPSSLLIEKHSLRVAFQHRRCVQDSYCRSCSSLHSMLYDSIRKSESGFFDQLGSISTCLLQVRKFSLQELELSFTQGRWDYARWGAAEGIATIAAKPPGVELWSRLDAESEREVWFLLN